jgi:hypothetical protein
MNKDKHLFLCLTVFLFFHPVFAGELARVGIVNYTDKTGSKDYEYLSESIANGIDKSMQEKFEYIRTDSKLTQKVAKNSKLTELLDLSGVRDVSLKTKSDIVIYGSYSYNKENKLLVIKTCIYLKTPDYIIFLPEVPNAVDSTIFEAVDRVAEQIVQKITLIAIEQEEKAKEVVERASIGVIKLSKKKPPPESVKKKIYKEKEHVRSSVYLASDYYSNKFWRGSNFYGRKAGYIFTGIHYELIESVSLEASHELPLGGYAVNSTGSSLTNFYEFGSGIEYFPGEILWSYVILGLKYHYYYNSSERIDIKNRDMSMRYQSRLTGWLRIMLPLSFYLTFISDYYTDDDSGERSALGDIYCILSYRKNLLSIDILEGSFLGIQFSIAYYKNDREDLKSTSLNEGRSGISDMRSGIYLIQKVGIENLSLNASAYYIYVPMEEWYSDFGNDRHQILFQFGLRFNY